MDAILLPLLLEFLKDWDARRKLGEKFEVGICIDFEQFVCNKMPERFSPVGMIPSWLEQKYFNFKLLPFNSASKAETRYSYECVNKTIGDNPKRINWVIATIKELEAGLGVKP